MSPLPERFRRFGGLLLLAPVLILVLGAALSYVWNDDFWWYVGSGEAVLRAGEIPDRDPLLYTAPAGAWVYHSWLSTVLIAVLVRLGGIGAAVVWSALAAAALIAAVYTTDRADRYGLINAMAALLVLIAAGPRLYGKVEVLSWLFFAIFFRALDRAAGYTPRGAAVLAGLQLLWANLHGGYPLGILAAAAYAVGDQLSRWRRGRARPADGGRPRPWPLWLPILLFAVSLIGPGGIQERLAPFGESEKPTDELGTQLLLEWRSPFQVPEPRARTVFVLALAAGLLSFRGLSRRRPARLILFVGTAVLAALAVRHGTGLALCAALLVVRHAAERAPAQARAPSRKARGAARRAAPVAAAALGITLIAAAALLRAGRDGFEAGQSAGRFFTLKPRIGCPQAAAFVRERRLPREIFNDYQSGGFLGAALAPDYQVFIDGRVLDPKLVARYTEMVANPGAWRAATERYRFHTAVLGLYSRTVRSPLGAALQRDPQWRLVSLDPLAAVFVRRTDIPRRLELRLPGGDPPFVGPLRGALRRAASALQWLLLADSPDNHLIEFLAAVGQLGFAGEVQGLASAALEALPDHPLLLRQRCAAALVLRAVPQALADCQRASALAPDDSSITALRGEALVAAGRRAEAVSLLEAALRRRPRDAALQQHLERLRRPGP